MQASWLQQCSIANAKLIGLTRTKNSSEQSALMILVHVPVITSNSSRLLPMLTARWSVHT